jgi:hypothetical protein
MKMVATGFWETFILIGPTRRQIQEDVILHSHRLESFNSYKPNYFWYSDYQSGHKIFHTDLYAEFWVQSVLIFHSSSSLCAVALSCQLWCRNMLRKRRISLIKSVLLIPPNKYAVKLWILQTIYIYIYISLASSGVTHEDVRFRLVTGFIFFTSSHNKLQSLKIMYNLGSSLRWQWRMPSSGMLRRVAFVRNDVPSKRRFLQEPHGVTSQKTAFFPSNHFLNCFELALALQLKFLREELADSSWT